jgi:RNA polymerase sigma-70 factor (ECF subfamily)
VSGGGQPAGDDAFDQFYRAAYRRLVGQLFAVVGNLHEAEDVVQEAFVRALSRWPRIQRYEQPEAWVRRVAMNLAISRFRRLRREVAALLRLRHHQEPVSYPPAMDSLLETLRRLPDNQRAALILHDVLDLSTAEVAAQLGLPVATVRGRIARARALLRRHLGDSESRGDHVNESDSESRGDYVNESDSESHSEPDRKSHGGPDSESHSDSERWVTNR